MQHGKHRFKKHLNCVPSDYKTGEAYKGKKLQGYRELHELFTKNYNWIWQEVGMLDKKELGGVRKASIVIRGDLETTRLQLAGVLNTAGGVLERGAVQRKFRFSVVQRRV